MCVWRGICPARPSEPGIGEEPPAAGFDTYDGTGIGRCNGKSAVAKWRFTDGVEPGTADTAEITITGGCQLTVAGPLVSGNHQAHEQQEEQNAEKPEPASPSPSFPTPAAASQDMVYDDHHINRRLMF